ncbi:uncharacterized protein [Physcomitrium patens]|uniref:SOUL heme-binding protein n=1 Tax=Physcomitrium patens TaxID=3218 RepID=A0A2K1JFY8_PHYPA|nr:uncharacterized protein LOC112291343 [Physcomitrium patens]PNR40450.1 hypothetical protein PHYPA_017852 [Physcomitrium patens]|eukprot:XP_024394369.1 uncharacterized protein LOC112291343 [Physcomitrella patens]
MGSGQVMVMLLLLSCVAFEPADGAFLSWSESVLQLFSTAEQPSACGPKVGIETPKCKVILKKRDYELRRCNSKEIWVETMLENSTYESATITGFYRCTNSLGFEITAPVYITPVPRSNGYKVAFFVSSRIKNVNDLPTSTDPEVYFYRPEGAVKAVLGPFGGFPTDKDYAAKVVELKKALDRDGLKYDEKSTLFADYSSPLQFRNRKQEVHVNIISHNAFERLHVLKWLPQ